MKNSFKKGKGWDGAGKSQPMTITYNGEEKTLDQWAMLLDIAPGSLRDRVSKASNGVIEWDEAMMDGPARVAYGNLKRAKNLAEAADKAKKTRSKNRRKKAEAQKKAEDAMRMFANAPIPR